MILPNFIFAGAPKSGSSTLFEYIRQHPDVCMSKIKEPFFFDFNYEKGRKYYESLFAHYKGERIVGEATVWYMSWPSVPARMHELIPDAKLLFVLRNPIERAFSDYMMNLRDGYYTPQQTFDYVIRNEQKVQGLDRRVTSGGFYYRHLKRFERYFTRKQMLIVTFREMKKDIRAVERKIYSFLDIDSEFCGNVIKDRMVAPYIHSLEKLILTSQKIPLFDLGWKKSRHFRQLFLDFQSKKKNVISESARNYLFDLYYEQNKILAKHLNIDLSEWESR